MAANPAIVTCRSAFAGFGLYRTRKFLGVRYDASVIRTAPASELAALRKFLEGLVGTPLTLEQIREARMAFYARSGKEGEME